MNYQISTTATLTGFFTLQMQHRSMASINPTGSNGSGAAGSAAYPLANAWSEALGRPQFFAPVSLPIKAWDAISLDVNYIFTPRRQRPWAMVMPRTQAFFNQLTAVQAGTSFPDILFDSHSLRGQCCAGRR